MKTKAIQLFMKHNLPKRFFPFIITESLGAFNDNFFKMLIQLYVLTIIVAPNAKNIIAMAALVFTVPYVIFGPWSGYLSDRFSKTRIMQVVKFCELPVMGLGVLAFYFGNINMMIVVLFLMTTQSAFFAPAKAGFIPETCDAELISKANGIMGMTTFLFIIMGTALGGILLSAFNNNALTVTYICIAIAVLGFVTSLFMTKTKPSGASIKFPINPFTGITRDLIFLKKQKGLFLSALANSYFWFLGIVFQSNITVYATVELGLTKTDNTEIAILPAIIGVGIALGSMLASRWSGKKVEIGLVPLGGIGLAISSIALYFSAGSYHLTAAVLFFSGIFGGLYIIPLYSYLQFEADEKEKGRVLATAGVMNGLFLVLGSLLWRFFAVTLDISPAMIFLIMGIITFFATIYICTVIPEYFMRFLSWLMTHTFYRIKIKGVENVPLKGPALLVPNHVSFVDALLVGATIQRFIKFIMYKKYYDFPIIRNICRIMEVIPIAPYEGRESVTETLNQAREKLKSGDVVCIFAEGGLTRDGEMKEFKGGLESIMAGIDCPIIPVYMHNVWGSIFSYEGGKFIWKWPKKIPYPITITYGKPMHSKSTAADVQEAVIAIANQF